MYSYIYNVFSYQISHSQPQFFISYCH